MSKDNQKTYFSDQLLIKIIMGLIEKIKEIEEEMARTQKNKATEYHMG
jgi:hypothetical protein